MSWHGAGPSSRSLPLFMTGHRGELPLLPEALPIIVGILGGLLQPTEEGIVGGHTQHLTERVALVDGGIVLYQGIGKQRRGVHPRLDGLLLIARLVCGLVSKPQVGLHPFWILHQVSIAIRRKFAVVF